MRVFSQINNCQQKQNKTKKQKQKQKTDKTKRGAPLLGLAKSIYFILFLHFVTVEKPLIKETAIANFVIKLL